MFDDRDAQRTGKGDRERAKQATFLARRLPRQLAVDDQPARGRRVKSGVGSVFGDPPVDRVFCATAKIPPPGFINGFCVG